MPQFDQFVAIDWSGARQTNTAAIAVAHCRSDGAINLLHPDTNRHWSRQLVCDYLLNLAAGSKRVLVGIDCNLGLPAPIVKKLIPEKASGRRLWRALHTIAPDTENFYAEPVWSSDRLSPYFWQHGPMPANWPHLRRRCETECIQLGLGRPESTLKLIGSKQVGKGGLAGMLMIHSLLARTDQIAVWPFDSAKQLSAARVVICEIYPRLWLLRAGLRAKIRREDELTHTLKMLTARYTGSSPYSDHETDALTAAAGLRADAQSGYDLLKHMPPHNPAGADIAVEGWIHSVPMQEAFTHLQ